MAFPPSNPPRGMPPIPLHALPEGDKQATSPAKQTTARSSRFATLSDDRRARLSLLMRQPIPTQPGPKPHPTLNSSGGGSASAASPTQLGSNPHPTSPSTSTARRATSIFDFLNLVPHQVATRPATPRPKDLPPAGGGSNGSPKDSKVAPTTTVAPRTAIDTVANARQWLSILAPAVKAKGGEQGIFRVLDDEGRQNEIYMAMQGAPDKSLDGTLSGKALASGFKKAVADAALLPKGVQVFLLDEIRNAAMAGPDSLDRYAMVLAIKEGIALLDPTQSQLLKTTLDVCRHTVNQQMSSKQMVAAKKAMDINAVAVCMTPALLAPEHAKHFKEAAPVIAILIQEQDQIFSADSGAAMDSKRVSPSSESLDRAQDSPRASPVSSAASDDQRGSPSVSGSTPPEPELLVAEEEAVEEPPSGPPPGQAAASELGMVFANLVELIRETNRAAASDSGKGGLRAMRREQQGAMAKIGQFNAFESRVQQFEMNRTQDIARHIIEEFLGGLGERPGEAPIPLDPEMRRQILTLYSSLPQG